MVSYIRGVRSIALFWLKRRMYRNIAARNRHSIFKLPIHCVSNKWTRQGYKHFKFGFIMCLILSKSPRNVRNISKLLSYGLFELLK